MVCRETWCDLHGIGKDRFSRIFKAVLEGKLSAPIDARYLRRGSQKTPSAKWGEVHSHLLEIYECQAETLPDDADSDGCGGGSSADENAQTPMLEIVGEEASVQQSQQSGPVVNPAPVRAERFLPPSSMFDHWKQMIVLKPHLKCSFRLFWKCWCQDFSMLKIRKGFKHHCCTVCLKHKALIRQLAHDLVSRDKQRALWQRHIDSQYEDRCYYWDLRTQSRLLRRPIILICDAADQAKFCWPRNKAFRAHQFDSMVRPRLHIVGLIVHGYLDLLAVSHCDVHTGGSSTVELMSWVLTRLKSDGVSLKGRELYFQLDNAASSNKNITLFTWMACLSALTGLSKCVALFLRSGHSHEDIDQQHGQMASWTANRLGAAETVDDFINGPNGLREFLTCLSRPYERGRHVLFFDEMRNWKKYLQALGVGMKGHGGQRAPHVFDFSLEKSQVILRRGESKSELLVF
eukprot:Skav234293  [mRNA]  locus=scaffold2271:187829:189208:+ [translate_table: standard]